MALAPRPPSGPPPPGLVSPFGAPRPMPGPGGVPLMPRPPLGRPMLPPGVGAGGGPGGVVPLPPLSPAPGAASPAPLLPGAVPQTPGFDPGMTGGPRPPMGFPPGAGGVPRPLLTAGADQFMTTVKGQKDRDAPAAAKLPPPFGYLHVVVAGCKGLTRAISDVSARAFVRATLGDQVKVTAQAKEGGPRPRFGDECVFDVRNDREIVLELLVRGAGDGPAGTATLAAGETVLASARSTIMPWISRGKFAGDIELRDGALQPCGSISLSVTYELSPASVAAASIARGGPASPGGADAAGRPGASAASVTVRDPNGTFTDAEIREAFMSFDLDGNNFVGAAELRHILTHIGEVVTDEVRHASCVTM